MKPLVLASSSPRRRALLRRLGVPFSVVVRAVDERALPGEAPAAHVRRLAREKALAVLRGLPAGGAARWVLGADTVIALDGEILGKPRDVAGARRMLARLSGRSHEVLTGVALVPVPVPVLEPACGRQVAAGARGRARTVVVRSRVTMRTLSSAAIREYVATGEPLDKAGAYAVQGRGGRLVARVAGSLTNVVGLPLERLERLLADCGLAADAPRSPGGGGGP